MIENVRKLNTADLFEFMRMVKRTGVKDELKKIAKSISENSETPKIEESTNVDTEQVESASKEEKKSLQLEVGIDLAFSIMEVFSNENAEAEIFKFLARPFNCKPEDVSQNELTDTLNKINEVADVQKWMSFFKSATQ